MLARQENGWAAVEALDCTRPEAPLLRPAALGTSFDGAGARTASALQLACTTATTLLQHAEGGRLVSLLLPDDLPSSSTDGLVVALTEALLTPGRTALRIELLIVQTHGLKPSAGGVEEDEATVRDAAARMHRPAGVSELWAGALPHAGPPLHGHTTSLTAGAAALGRVLRRAIVACVKGRAERESAVGVASRLTVECVPNDAAAWRVHSANWMREACPGSAFTLTVASGGVAPPRSLSLLLRPCTPVGAHGAPPVTLEAVGRMPLACLPMQLLISAPMAVEAKGAHASAEEGAEAVALRALASVLDAEDTGLVLISPLRPGAGRSAVTQVGLRFLAMGTQALHAGPALLCLYRLAGREDMLAAAATAVAGPSLPTEADAGRTERARSVAASFTTHPSFAGLPSALISSLTALPLTAYDPFTCPTGAFEDARAAWRRTAGEEAEAQREVAAAAAEKVRNAAKKAARAASRQAKAGATTARLRSAPGATNGALQRLAPPPAAPRLAAPVPAGVRAGSRGRVPAVESDEGMEGGESDSDGAAVRGGKGGGAAPRLMVPQPQLRAWDGSRKSTLPRPAPAVAARQPAPSASSKLRTAAAASSSDDLTDSNLSDSSVELDRLAALQAEMQTRRRAVLSKGTTQAPPPPERSAARPAARIIVDDSEGEEGGSASRPAHALRPPVRPAAACPRAPAPIDKEERALLGLAGVRSGAASSLLADLDLSLFDASVATPVPRPPPARVAPTTVPPFPPSFGNERPALRDVSVLIGGTKGLGDGLRPNTAMGGLPAHAAGVPPAHAMMSLAKRVSEFDFGALEDDVTDMGR